MSKKVNKEFEFPFNVSGLMDYYNGIVDPKENQSYSYTAKYLKKYYEFTEDMIIDGHSRGRSSIKINLKSLKDGQIYPMFISDFMDLQSKVVISYGKITGQTWGFIKKGQNYGIYMLEYQKDHRSIEPNVK